jgi:hypothetical protein
LVARCWIIVPTSPAFYWTLSRRYTLKLIDPRQHELHCADSTNRAVRIPFAYAEAGLLSHGYATTIHKAQGATVERALVLADDTMAAEHAYTALSRATARTDLYLDSGESDLEAHGPVIATPVRDRLAAAMSRSVAQHLAIDQTPDPLTPVGALRVERDRVRQELGGRPPDYSIDLRHLADRIRSTRHTLEHAHWRQHNAQSASRVRTPRTKRRRRHQPTHRRTLTAHDTTP